MPVTVRTVGAEATYPLRRRVLRPHQMARTVPFPGDGDPGALHVAAGDDGIIVAVGSILPVGDEWRVRGMATDPAHRSRGLGTLVLSRLLEHAGSAPVWCHARVAAARLYERAGFSPLGDPWDEPGLGPHILMRREPGLR